MPTNLSQHIIAELRESIDALWNYDDEAVARAHRHTAALAARLAAAEAELERTNSQLRSRIIEVDDQASQIKTLIASDARKTRRLAAAEAERNQISVVYTCCKAQEYWPLTENGELEMKHTELGSACGEYTPTYQDQMDELTARLAAAEAERDAERARAERFEAWGLDMEQHLYATEKYNPNRDHSDFSIGEFRKWHLHDGDLTDGSDDDAESDGTQP